MKTWDELKKIFTAIAPVSIEDGLEKLEAEMSKATGVELDAQIY